MREVSIKCNIVQKNTVAALLNIERGSRLVGIEPTGSRV
jgi:hypothetical protein